VPVTPATPAEPVTPVAPTPVAPTPVAPSPTVNPGQKGNFDFLEYKEEDWKSGGSAQADRDATVLNIFEILGDKEVTTYYKVGAVMVSVMQYFYKR